MHDDHQTDNRRELSHAEVLFRRREFATVVRDLAPQIFLHRGDRRYFFLLGISSLYIGDFGGAHSYLLRGKDLDPLNMDLLLGLAISHLWRKESTEALRLWVGIQDKHPKNKKAFLGLETLKQAPDKVDWTDQLRLGRLRSLYPEPGFDWYTSFRRAGIIMGGLAVILALAGLVFGIKGLIDRRIPPARPGIEESISGQSSNGAIDNQEKTTAGDAEFGMFPGDVSRFILSETEIKSGVVEIRNSFREYRDNKARVILNKLMQSNASEATKAQLRGLSTHFKEPGFTNFRDNYDLLAVSADPRLHAGAYVMWRGRIANLIKAEQVINFNFLVGYDNSKVVSGTVPVSLSFAANIHDGDPIELIGQVRPITTIPHFSLQARAIRLIKGND